MLEAGMLGLAGAAAGALTGGLFALINAGLRFGNDALISLSWGAVGKSFLVATGVGCLLSLLGVLYPAYVAARMQPVEAMRVEQ